MDKQIELMRKVLSDAYDGIQKLNIQATIFNVTAIEGNLKRLQLVYNTLGTMLEEVKEGGAENDSDVE